MVREVRVFIEGGGPTEDTRRFFRRAFQKFFERIRVQLKSNRNISFNVEICGGRSQTYAAYAHSHKTEGDRFSVLLVDSEEQVRLTPWEHVRTREGDGWEKVGGDDQLQFFVTVIETWFIVERSALRKIFGSNLIEGRLAVRANPEESPKEDVYESLRNATNDAYKKGDAYKIIEILSEETLRSPQARLSFAQRLFDQLENVP